MAVCQQFRRVSRRWALSLGAVGGLGLSLPAWYRLQAAGTGSAAKSGSFGAAKKVIFLFLHGGHPQHETWDPKPSAPANVRGEFGEIATTVPGLRISELFPLCARLADRLTFVRSMSHDNPNHVQACLPAMTGHKHPASVRGRGDFPPADSDFPHFGAVLDKLRPGENELPNWVQLGPVMTRNNRTVLHGQSSGFLGARHSPLKIDVDFTEDELQVDAITPRVGIRRIKNRRQLLAELDGQRRSLDLQASQVKDTYYERAYNLLTSSATRQAFDLAAEPESIRARYPDNHVGQACLVARRLVESGVPFVNVHYCQTPSGSWDTHSQNFRQMKESLAPTLDQTLAALLTDLEERGMLDDVLVMPMAEFGRTPEINKNAGRDHWPFVYSLAFAGAGLQRGAVIGRSDRLGAQPDSESYDPADMAATIYHLLGIPDSTVLVDRELRPHQLVVGKKIEAAIL
jgi:hypothetical protein